MKRVEGWEGILSAELEKASALTFAWGKADCATWAANIVLAMTGEDVIADLRGTYDSEDGAQRIIEQGGDLSACVDARLPRVEVTFARRGDVVMWGDALGVCGGLHSFFLTPQKGVRAVKTRQCQSAWKVG